MPLVKFPFIISVMPVLSIVRDAVSHSEGTASIGIEILAAIQKAHIVLICAGGILFTTEGSFRSGRGRKRDLAVRNGDRNTLQ